MAFGGGIRVLWTLFLVTEVMPLCKFNCHIVHPRHDIPYGILLLVFFLLVCASGLPSVSICDHPGIDPAVWVCTCISLAITVAIINFYMSSAHGPSQA